MIRRPNHRLSPRAAAPLALLSLGLLLSACAQMSDNMTAAFADPAKYDTYDCKQLETERKALSNRSAELQGLMAKAETGVAGSLVSEMAYRNDYIAVRGQSRNADEAWRRSHCRETPPDKAEAGAKPAPPSRAGRAVY
ncbi:twin-arginine translocation pathway signal [Bradyrhizobium sp. NP1]|uniref:twin-arginine translocation pathway signal n=1 Tax=Bradyrhizobium sp. NP1 TaxID=3049772 RepID=UPI0025A62DA4|nr:twin-arginine translocation pathway signal [Bradyrhizobium sp. NP1]WJR75997.1 twin-arginine translocation pathway signal [Bradyrhizobium sp. NP1]